VASDALVREGKAKRRVADVRIDVRKNIDNLNLYINKYNTKISLFEKVGSLP